MGGRGYNGKRRSQKTGGRGRGRSNTTKTTITPENNTAIMEFTPHTIGRHQLVTFDAVKEHILQELQIDLQHGSDIVDNLRSGVDKGIPLIKPKRKLGPKTKKKKVKDGEDPVEVETAPDERKILQQGHDMEWSMAMKEYNIRKGVYEENTDTAYGIIFSYCNGTMQLRIEESTDFESMIRNNPWKLLETIKLYMYGQVWAKY